MTQFSKYICLSFLSLVVTFSYAQGDIEEYIPRANSSYDYYPIVEINTVIHVVKKSNLNPDNLTEDSIPFILQQFEWINAFYNDLSKPTLPTLDGVEHYIPSARLKFNIDTILFHTNEADWNRIQSAENQKSPVKIYEVDTVSNTLIVKGSWKNKMFRADDSLKVRRIDSGFVTLHYSQMKEEGSKTVFVIKEPINPDSIGDMFAYYTEQNRNCSLDLWNKYTDSDREALHVFYTGSSKSGVAFGCGPEPFYLNVSNIIKGGSWAGAQLTAHELGHTLGLSHTNFPQFDDLPRSDKFGFIGCNDSLTSNNIMGYNMCRRYLSPMQVGHIHKLYSTKQDRIRLTNANEYIPDDPIYIWNDTTWTKAMVIRKDIVVRRGQTLEVKNQIHMAHGATIFLEPKSELIVNGAVVSNFFETKWQGVQICKSFENRDKLPRKVKNYGKLTLLNRGTFENSLLGQP